jgi:FKBP-type peptidyl-prolyl cis-trans isomerase
VPKFKTLFLLLSLILAGACQDFGSKSPQNEEIRLNKNPNSNNSTIAVHREFLKREQESIENYIADRNLNLQRNGTGIYYQIEADANGKNALKVKSGDDVRYHYVISLLNGSELYRSSSDEPAILRVDKEDAEIGLHDALKLMSLGDKGLFILPSHRAFGVSGDQNKIPPFTALVYDLEIVEIQKLQNP